MGATLASVDEPVGTGPRPSLHPQAVSSCFGSDSGGLQGSEALLSVWLMWSVLLGVPPGTGHSWGSSGLRERVLDGSKRIPGLPWPHLPCKFEVPFPLSLSLSSSVEARSWVEMTPEALQGPQFSFLCTGCSYTDHTGTGTLTASPADSGGACDILSKSNILSKYLNFQNEIGVCITN